MKLPRRKALRGVAIDICDADSYLNQLSFLYIMPYNLVIKFLLFIKRT
jgi:hypothetical protein